MPIILDDNRATIVDAKGQVTTDAKSLLTFSPKFFNDKLTGKGSASKRGLLSDQIDPKMMPNGYNIIDSNIKYGKISNSNKTIYNIPCSLIPATMWNYIEHIDRPELAELTQIATDITNKIKVYLYAPIYAVQIEETDAIQPDGKISKTHNLYASMAVFVFKTEDDTIADHRSTTNISSFSQIKKNLFYRKLTSDLRQTIRDIVTELTNLRYTVDKAILSDFFDNYSIYSELCRASERWQTKAADIIADILVKNVNTFTNGSTNAIWWSEYNSVHDALARLEKYSVPLDQYQLMFNKLEKIVSADILSQICKANLNLRLSNTLSHMNQNKQMLNYCPCNVHIQGTIPYSKEQRQAIESTSPLTLIQSGAGTGKSTVILGRIDHMIKNGIDPQDITILSFTNAAADHIRDLKPGINSMTIASMIHSIYSFNFKDHQLSTIPTIINSIDIYFEPSAIMPNSPASKISQNFIYDFKHILKRLEYDKEYTQATNYIEANIDDVIATLDIIKQTSLALESIICYTKMDTLVEPPEAQTKHLIIDEVQDNSIAEFIYSIKYIDKHHASMYIVGDCSQTLFEFRASNPKALNILENSGIFDIYKLQTNYRSNQEILDFANFMLDNIEANQYANIQLKANSLKPVTLQSFQDAVNLTYKKLPHLSDTDVDNMLLTSLSSDMKNYIDDKIAKKEQICILAFAGATLFKIQQYLTGLYPNAKSVSLVPKKSHDSTMFSQFIARFWGQVKFIPPQSIIDAIENIMQNNIMALVSKNLPVSAAANICTQTVSEFRSAHGATIKEWEKQVQQNLMSIDQLLEETKKLMIGFEIKKNGIMHALTSKRNEISKTTDTTNDATFILSTIHSAKGLEFDNVIVYYKNDDKAIEEESKRMYYVAFTRAKKTEYIYAYGTKSRPKIQADYERAIRSLTAQAKANGTLTTSQPITVMPTSLTPMPLPPSVTSFVSDAALKAPTVDTTTEQSNNTTNTKHHMRQLPYNKALLMKQFKSNNIKSIMKKIQTDPKAKHKYNKMILRKRPDHIT